MRSRWLIIFIFIFASGFILTQCSSNKYIVNTRNMAPDRSFYDVKATLTYLTDEDLIKRFGPQDNPYLSPGTLMSGSDIVTVEVSIQNKTENGKTIIVPLENMRMLVGNSSHTPTNAYKLSSFWQTFLDKDQDTRQYKSTAGKMRFIINETMFANPAIIDSGDSYSGIVVFMGRYTQYGYAEISVPVFDREKRVIGIFVEEFERY